MNIYKLMFQQLESDFLELSRNSPMHGVLTAIRLSLKMAIGDKEFIDDLQTTVSKIADAMLIILTGCYFKKLNFSKLKSLKKAIILGIFKCM